jgi:hypothetical protein
MKWGEGRWGQVKYQAKGLKSMYQLLLAAVTNYQQLNSLKSLNVVETRNKKSVSLG